MERGKKGDKRWLKLGSSILTLVAGYSFYQFMVSHPPEIKKVQVQPHYPTVEIVTVEPQKTTLSVHSQGTVRPRMEMILKPEVTGRVLWISDKLVNGGVFDQDDKLLEIDPTDYKTELASAETALARAEVEFNHAQREYRRNESLKNRNLASDAQLDQSRRNFKLAEAQLSEAKIRLHQARTNLERTTIHAPFTGRVREEHVDLGQFLSRGEQVATLYSTDYFEVRLPIGIEQFAFLDIPPGTRGVLPHESALEVTITGSIGDSDYQWPGKLERTEGEIDAKTRLVYGVVKVENIPAQGQVPLMVGLFVKADIKGLELDNIITLPRSALRDNNRVLVVDKESRLRFRNVNILRVQGDKILIQGGLEAGEEVCVSPLLVVVDGMRVNTAPQS